MTDGKDKCKIDISSFQNEENMRMFLLMANPRELRMALESSQKGFVMEIMEKHEMRLRERK